MELLLFILLVIMGLRVMHIWMLQFPLGLLGTLFDVLEKRVYEPYKKILLEYSIKGMYIGSSLGPLIIILFYLSIVNSFATLVMITFVMTLSIPIYFFIGIYLGGILGFIINFIFGATLNLLKKIRFSKDQKIDFTLDFYTLSTVLIIGFITGILTSEGSVFKGVIGALLGLVIAYLDKFKTWGIFYLARRTIIASLSFYKKIILIITVFCIYLSSFNYFGFQMNQFLRNFMNYVPIVFVLLYFEHLKDRSFVRYCRRYSYRRLHRFFIKYTSDKSTKLPRNIFLHVFAGFLVIVLTAFLKQNSDFVFLFCLGSLIFSIAAIEFFPKVLAFPVFGIMIEPLPMKHWNWTDPISYWFHILLWVIYGQAFLYLLNNGSNRVDSKKIDTIVTWLEEDKELDS